MAYGAVVGFDYGWVGETRRPVIRLRPRHTVVSLVPALEMGARVLIGAGIGAAFGATTSHETLWLAVGAGVGWGFGKLRSTARGEPRGEPRGEQSRVR